MELASKKAKLNPSSENNDIATLSNETIDLYEYLIEGTESEIYFESSEQPLNKFNKPRSSSVPLEALVNQTDESDHGLYDDELDTRDGYPFTRCPSSDDLARDLFEELDIIKSSLESVSLKLLKMEKMMLESNRMDAQRDTENKFKEIRQDMSHMFGNFFDQIGTVYKELLNDAEEIQKPEPIAKLVSLINGLWIKSEETDEGLTPEEEELIFQKIKRKNSPASKH